MATTIPGHAAAASESVCQWSVVNPHRGFVRGKWTAWLEDELGRATHRATADRKHLAVARRPERPLGGRQVNLLELIDAGAIFYLSHSGGKDSQAMYARLKPPGAP